MYRFVRPLLFRLDAEVAHHVALQSLQWIPKVFFKNPPSNPVKAMGVTFPHRVGLAAGLDKNAEYLDALSKLGFSFIEVGTVTPRPQSGHPKPRLFRLPKAHAIINRMGFNNKGIDALIHNVKKSRYQGILGINIGKNRDTPLQKAADDYLYCFERAYEQASYVAINISSPNTPDLRQLQTLDYLQDLLKQLREQQQKLSDKHQRHVPLVVKLSPDESDENLKNMAEVILTYGIEGIIATNTTCDHSLVRSLPHGNENGGLSGQPLAERSSACLRVLKEVVGEDVTLIGVGGIDCEAVAKCKLQAGASLLQVYTGLIYQGPGLLRCVIN